MEEMLNQNKISMALFYKDAPGKMDIMSPLAEDTDANLGLKVCYAFTKNSNIVDMMGPIHCDIFSQDHLILNGLI